MWDIADSHVWHIWCAATHCNTLQHTATCGTSVPWPWLTSGTWLIHDMRDVTYLCDMTHICAIEHIPHIRTPILSPAHKCDMTHICDMTHKYMACVTWLIYATWITYVACVTFYVSHVTFIGVMSQLWATWPIHVHNDLTEALVKFLKFHLALKITSI